MTDTAPGVPPRISFVTLGAVDVAELRRFYRAWGWSEGPGGTADFAQFLLENTRFALYRRQLLHEEAAPDLPDTATGAWSGMTLAVNVGSREAVDVAYDAALAAGAHAIAHPTARDWGGWSGYVSDPEGHRWEIAWLPGHPADDGPPAVATGVSDRELDPPGTQPGDDADARVRPPEVRPGPAQRRQRH